MTLRKNSAEGGSNGVTPTPGSGGNTGGTSGDYFDTITFGPQFTFNTGTSMHGSVSYHCADTAASQSPLFRYSGYSATQAAYRFYARFNSAPSAATQIWTCRPTSGTAASINYNSNGTVALINSAGSSRNSFTPTVGTWYRIEVQLAIGASTSTGTLNWQVYAGDSLTSVTTYASTTDNTSTGNNISYFDLGKVTAAPTGFSVDFDDIAVNDGTLTPIGLPVLPPTAAFSATVVGTDAICDSSASAPVSPATITSKAWTFGDGGTATGDSPTHQYTSAGTYTIGLTVTDSNGQTASVNHSAVITMPGTSGAITAATAATGTSPTTLATVLTDLADTSSGAPVLTTWVNVPDTATYTVKFGPVVAPQSGQPAIWPFLADRVQSSTGTITAKLYQGDPDAGGTLRSTVAVTIPDTTASGGSGDATTGAVGSNLILLAIWPPTDVVNVTDWNQMYGRAVGATA